MVGGSRAGDTASFANGTVRTLTADVIRHPGLGGRWAPLRDAALHAGCGSLVLRIFDKLVDPKESAVTDYLDLPTELPVPQDDGAADHLPGTAMPHIELQSTAGRTVALDQLGPGRTVLYIYPRSGVPGEPLPEGWDAIPGARGCTPEACGFRDHHAELGSAGAANVYGLSSQDTDYQAELVDRLNLPFEILSDPELALVDALGLPTFIANGAPLYKRITLILADGRIEHAFYPIFPPDQHASEVLEWLSERG